ncbi:MAG: hypothetical protein HY722_11820, partial [Planctomycetes bacterium]|nr:hypothetical protein [Planctomycetota bacterium]
MFKLILTKVDATQHEALQDELAQSFGIDQETASHILENAPLILLDGLSFRAVNIVKSRLAGLVALGAQIHTTDAPADDIPKVNWPEMPEIAQVEGEPVGGTASPDAPAARPKAPPPQPSHRPVAAPPPPPPAPPAPPPRPAPQP